MAAMPEIPAPMTAIFSGATPTDGARIEEGIRNAFPSVRAAWIAITYCFSLYGLGTPADHQPVAGDRRVRVIRPIATGV